MIYRFNVRQSMRCFADILAINRENKARYSSIIVCITFAQYCMFCFQRRTRFFVRLLTLRCSNGHALLFQLCPIKQNNLLMKCASGHTLSMLKPISFVIKWWCVVSVLSPLASKSYGGSYMQMSLTRKAVRMGYK